MDERMLQIGCMVKDAALEALWPTRCAICDREGLLVCEECQRSLPFLDQWQACPRCGSARGLVQCCSCDAVSMESIGLSQPPFDGCVSAMELNADSGRIVTLCKDGGEQRLAGVMAAFVASAIPPAWRAQRPFVSYVPASEKAFRRRGYDHAELLARQLADKLALQGGALFFRPRTRDQRTLSREERFANMESCMKVNPKVSMPDCVLLVDDVFTTGATLFAASAACKQAGAHTVYCATFARTELG